MDSFNCVECFFKTGEYPNFACGKCGRYAAGDEMSKEKIDEYITDAYNAIIRYMLKEEKENA